MRADRLISAILLLQGRGQMTGRELAEHLEVSERTIHRDMEALSSAGVPVFASRGSKGGWQLDEDWRTEVPGLDEAELHALLMAQPRGIANTRLASAAERAIAKLMASLPDPMRERAASLRARLHVDPAEWGGRKEDLSMLPVVQEALTTDRKLYFRYIHPDEEHVERTVDPLGLIAKGNSWYLFAQAPHGLRTYRVSRMYDARVLDQPGERPKDFDLETYWKISTGRFQEEVNRERAQRLQRLAQRREAERRVAQELQIAKEVQARLFPQKMPELQTLDFAGICLQARQVGGDYYDFLDLGEDRMGVVLADISGKGIAAALLMANLQANMRGQCAIARNQPERLLRSVNQLFFENTADNAYATLFFAEFDDRTQRLDYINCGHLPGLILRAEGSVERLGPTGTVLGLFGEWECETGERRLFAGDMFALYTDGVTEACNEDGEEFGDERLIAALRKGGTARDVACEVVDEVRRFSVGEQSDDITLIVAQCRNCAEKPLELFAHDA